MYIYGRADYVSERCFKLILISNHLDITLIDTGSIKTTIKQGLISHRAKKAF